MTVAGLGAAWARLRPLRWTFPAAGLFTLLRVPAFLEPHWYTDEGGAAAAARALLTGKVLYTQVWSNKPPLHLWTVALDVVVFRGSEWGLHVVTFASSAAALAAVAYLAAPLLGRRRAMLALLLAAVALGTPLFDAELALPESFLIAPASWAAAIVIRHALGVDDSSSWRWPVGAGVLMAAAIAYQQTAVADALALGLVLVLSPRLGWRPVLGFAVTVSALTATWLGLALLTAGPAAVAYGLVGFYIPYSQSVLPSSGGELLRLGLTLVGATALVCAGAALTRRSTRFLWPVWVWAAADVLVAGAAQMPYAHFLLPAVVPLCIAAASLRLPTRRAVTLASRAGAVAVLSGTGVALSVGRIAGVDWVPALSANGAVTEPRDLAAYYGNALAVLARQQSLAAEQATFDQRVAGDRDTAAWLRQHGLSGRSGVAWSSDAWLYVMANLQLGLPTPPIYNDEVLLGTQGQVASAVADLDPDVIVTSDDALEAFPEVRPLLAANYREVDREEWNTVWLRDDDALSGP
ncbi:MAG: glycosyltransferase family 39 protein [Candidatus Dormibacteria bacterium]